MAMSQKQKTLSTLAVVAALAAALASYAWFDIYQKGLADQKMKDVGNTLFTFKKDDVKKMVITAKGETTVVEREGGDWKITAPIQTRADKMPVEAVVDKLAGLKRKRGIDSPGDLKDYGLVTPRIKVVVTLDGRQDRRARRRRGQRVRRHALHRHEGRVWGGLRGGGLRGRPQVPARQDAVRPARQTGLRLRRQRAAPPSTWSGRS